MKDSKGERAKFENFEICLDINVLTYLIIKRYVWKSVGSSATHGEFPE